METITHMPMLHMGKKIERVRRLRGMTQTELGRLLGITKQAVSKMEQTQKIPNEKAKQAAEALGVTEEGLLSFNEEKVLYNTNNFYENCGVTATSICANAEIINNFPIEKTIEIFEKILKMQQDIYKKEMKAKR